MLSGKSDYIGIRISVKKSRLFLLENYFATLITFSTGGCNGYTYIMNYAKTQDLLSGKDEVVQSHGVTVLVDPKAIFFIVGTEMNYEVSLLTFLTITLDFNFKCFVGN